MLIGFRNNNPAVASKSFGDAFLNRFGLFFDKTAINAIAARNKPRIWYLAGGGYDEPLRLPDPMPNIKEIDYPIFNEILNAKGDLRPGWSIQEMSSAIVQLPYFNKIILNERLPVISISLIQLRMGRWQKLRAVADELSKTFPGKIAIGMQLHVRDETRQFIADGLASMLSIFEGYEIHLTEVSCAVSDGNFDRAGEFFAQVLQIASEAGVASLTPWFLFDEADGFFMPGLSANHRVGMFARDDIKLYNPRPAWTEIEKYLP